MRFHTSEANISMRVTDVSNYPEQKADGVWLIIRKIGQYVDSVSL